MFSRKMECGMPMGLRFFMAARSVRSPTCLLPRKRMRPTLTLGPSLMTKVTPTAAGGMGRTSVRMVANWRPCSASSCLRRTSAFLIFRSDLGPLLNDESDADGGGRDGPHFGADGGELASMLGEQLLEDNFGLLDLRGFVLILNREPDFALLEAVEHVAGGNGIQAGVVDLADGRPLFEVKVQDPTFGALFALKADVLKVAGVPESVEVAFDGGGVVDVAGLAEDASLDRVGGDAAVAVDFDVDNEILLADKG